MRDDCPASFPRHVAQIGPPDTANGRVRATKVGYDFSTNWAIQRCFPVIQGPWHGRWLCVMCDDPAGFSRHVAQIGPPNTANDRSRARKAGYELSTKWAMQRCFPVIQFFLKRYGMTS